MKLKIDKNILLENLVNVAKAISPKNIIPILNGIMFKLTKEGLYLLASDSDLTIKAFIPQENIIKIEQEGIIIIQSKYIIDIIKKMPTDEINIEVIDGLKIRIYTENSQYNLNCLNSEEYPNIVLEDAKTPITIKSDLIKQMIKQTIFAVSLQESRPLLTGLNLKINGNILECVATDSYRLAKKAIMLDDTYPENVDIVIPGKNITELDKILSDNEDIEIHLFSNKALFKYKNIIFQTNLLSGSYPNVNILNISSFSSEIGKVEDKLTITKNTDKDIAISFSAKYMMEALRALTEEEILILLNNDSSPIIIKSVNDESLIQLILPIKTY